MHWLIDECADAAIALELRGLGHDVSYIAEVSPAAMDDEVIRRAQSESRLLLTEDKDFGDLVFRRAHDVPGLVLLRIEPVRRALKVPRLRFAIDRLGEHLFGRYTVVDEARIRSRQLRAASP